MNCDDSKHLSNKKHRTVPSVPSIDLARSWVHVRAL